jgi:aspartate-semialdehyde dehydrogenase
MRAEYDMAVVGATGAVGETILELLNERKFPISEIHAVASNRSAGTRVSFGKKMLVVQDLDTFDFSSVDICLFSPGSSISKIFAPKAAAKGCVVIDNTSEFRYDDDIPLIVPEVNLDAISGYTKRNIIANPNCSTIQMVVALKPIYDAVGIERVNVCTYQAVSGTGKDGIEELAVQTANILNSKDISSQVYPKQIAFNCLPQIDVFQENGYTKEEMKMVWETQKIMSDSNLLVNPTAVRVPVFYGHSEAVHIETSEKITADDARKLLKNAAGVQVIDDMEDGGYPTAVTDAANNDECFVGRIREDISCPKGLNMWIVSDNVRKGAALNSVQIAEKLVENGLRPKSVEACH